MKKLVVFMAALALGCSSSDEGGAETTSMDIVTGITFRQNFDDAPLQLGNPNVLVDGKFVVYPNPANDVVILQAESAVSDVWIVPARARKIYQDVNFGSVLTNGLYPEATISSNSDFSLNGQSASTLSLNISALPPGYYRVFAKIGGQLYWDNLYKNDADGGSENEIAAIMAYWN